MNPEDRRRFAAVAALVLGVFLALTLISAVPTGPIGRGLGDFFWRVLGAGAVGLPLLGLGLGLAGFDRIPRLDMKRAAILLGGLALLVPFTLGVLTNATADGFDPPLPEWAWPARLTGIVPGFAARGVVAGIGQLGGLAVAFLALSALTLATLAWHPLQRLEKPPAGRPAGSPEGMALPSRPGLEPDADEEDFEPLPRKAAKSRDAKARPALR